MISRVISIEGKGDIHYWVSGPVVCELTLVFLPGLTADHRLFESQIECFSKKYRTLVWDAPAHYMSRPWSLDFSLMDLAEYLHIILGKEGIESPVLIGQSLGGYVAQCYMQRYGDAARAFVSIDSAPLQRRYMNCFELWMLKRTKHMFECFSWKTLLNATASACAVSAEGQALMKNMMLEYGKREYIALAAHGYKILAEAVEADLPYEISCPCLLICGAKDSAGRVKAYNRAWGRREGMDVHWIQNAAHNSNADRPAEVNALIESFLQEQVKLNPARVTELKP